VKVCARPSEVRCPLCRSPLPGNATRTCERCRTATHAACADELAIVCPTSGCEPSARTRIVVVTASRRPVTTSRFPTDLSVVMVGLALLFILAVAAVTQGRATPPTCFEGATTKVYDDITVKINAG
jgi:hypothetical protein